MTSTLIGGFAQHLSESAAYIKNHHPHAIDALVILGSGLGDFAGTLENATVLPYGQIPHFCESAIEGHAGNLVLGELKNASGQTLHLACMQGRFHYYEGHDLATVTFPVRVARQLGARFLVVTNAAGGINPGLPAGSLMMITDHLNLMGQNPLLGKNPVDLSGQPLGPRFPDMSEAYCKQLQAALADTARGLGVDLKSGVYAALSGPTYETPAEVRMLRTLGADAVGMSTVPEVIVARHSGLRVAGISCITNAAAGTSDQHLDHSEVMDTANRVKTQFIALLDGFLKRLAGL